MEISFEEFKKIMLQLSKESHREEYYDEIFKPFFRMCCLDSVKVVSVFNEKQSGKKTNTKTPFKEKMSFICAKNEKNENVVVPDYIFVASNYTETNPSKPYIMVEVKKPRIKEKKGKILYAELRCNSYEEQLKAEANTCGYVIFTDGLTWKFLQKGELGELKESEEFPTIKLVEEKNTIYDKIYREIDWVSNKETEWNDLIEQIKKIIVMKEREISQKGVSL